MTYDISSLQLLKHYLFLDVFIAENYIWFMQRLPFVDVATGSLGQGLSCAAGMAYVGKYIDKAQWVVWQQTFILYWQFVTLYICYINIKNYSLSKC